MLKAVPIVFPSLLSTVLLLWAQISFLVHSATHQFLCKYLVKNTSTAAAGWNTGPVLSPCPDSTCAPPYLPAFTPHCLPLAHSCSPQCWLGLATLLGSSLFPLTKTPCYHHLLVSSTSGLTCDPLQVPIKPSPPGPRSLWYSHPPEYTHSPCYHSSALNFIISAYCSYNFRGQLALPLLSLMAPTGSSSAGTQCSTYRWPICSNSLSDATASTSAGNTDLLCDRGVFLPLSRLFKVRMIFSSANLTDRGILNN